MVHLHKKIHHHLTHHKKQSTALGAALCLVIVCGTFFITRGEKPHMSELSFTEHSTLGADAGSVIPASCDSNPYVPNGDGNYSGCATVVCGATHFNCDAGVLGASASYGAPDYQHQWWCNGVSYATDNQPNVCVEIYTPSCSSVGPGGNPSVQNNVTTYDVYAYGVSNATEVLFPTWSDTGGQDDLIWIPGTNLGGGTWKATVNFGTQPTTGQFWTHVYMKTHGVNQTFCGAANFIHLPPATVQVNFSLEDYIKAKALAVVSSLKDLAFAPVLAEGTK